MKIVRCSMTDSSAGVEQPSQGSHEHSLLCMSCIHACMTSDWHAAYQSCLQVMGDVAPAAGDRCMQDGAPSMAPRATCAVVELCMLCLCVLWVHAQNSVFSKNVSSLSRVFTTRHVV